MSVPSGRRVLWFFLVYAALLVLLALLHPDGYHATVVILALVAGAAGAVVAALALSRLRLLEAAREESEARYCFLVEAMPHPAWTCGPFGTIEFANRRFCEYTGLALPRVSDTPLKAVIHPQDLAAVEAGWRGRPVRTPHVVEFRFRGSAGTYRWFLGTLVPVTDSQGRVLRWVGTALDIDDQKRAADSIRLTKERYRSVVDHAQEGIVTIDESGMVETFNPAAEKLFGYSAREIIGRNVALLMPEPFRSDHGKYINSYLSTGEAKVIGVGREVTGRRKDGSTFPADLAVSVFRLDERRRFTGFVRDITRQKALENELRDRAAHLTEVDRRKDEFLAMLSHELRNPLAPIRNAVELLRHLGPQDAPAGHYRDMIERQVQHLTKMVDDLLDVSRITRGKVTLQPEVVDVARVVANAVETCLPLVEEKGHELKVHMPQMPLPVQADPVRLAQVFSNLLTNSAKYMDEGGSIWVAAERQGQEVVIRVRDAGMGIPQELLPRVFDLFTQGSRGLARTEGGLGIGLSLVRSLVEMHGGHVTAHSAGPGLGSEFVVRLPSVAAPSQVAAGTPNSSAPPPPPAALRLLVVDDNRDSTESIALLAQMWGHNVRTALDGVTAVEEAKKHNPDVVLLDIGLPGMDGYQVARRLREDPNLTGVVLVAMTGYGREEDRRRAHEAGFQHHLVKPVDPSQLRTLLATQPTRGQTSNGLASVCR
jgi:PAS domain S-box-containing protein